MSSALRAAGRLVSAPTVLLFGALMAASSANFAYHLIAGRLLTAADYGLVGALLAMLTSVSFAAAALEVSITRTVGHAPSNVRLAVHRWLWTAAALGGAVAVSVQLLAPVLRARLGVDDPVVVPLLAAFFPILAVGLVARGICLGRLGYRRAAGVVVTGAVVRLLVLGLGAVPLGVPGAVLAVILAEATAMVGYLASVRGHLDHDGHRVRIQWHSGLLSATALAGFWLLVNLDTVLARTVLSPADAGDYAAASVVAKTALFAPLAVVTVVYPRFVAEPRQRARLLGRAVLAAAALGGAVVAVLAWRPALLLGEMFGGRLTGGSDVLVGLASAAAALGVLSVVLYYHLAGVDLRSLGCWAGCVATVVVATSGSPSQARLVASLLAGGTVSALALTVGVRRTWHDRVGERRVAGLHDAALLDLTVVVPFYNGGPAVRDTVERIIAELRGLPVSFEVIAVSDGSTDDSLDELRRIDDPALTVVCLETNQGKGAALQAGLQVGRGHYLGFIDADGDIDPALWQPFVTLLALYQPDVVLGSKRHPLSDVSYPPLRWCYSWGYQQLIRVLFRLNVRDTQTGIKVIRREVLAAVLPRMVERRFTFDLELLAVARHLGYRRFLEAPIRIRHRAFGSTVSWRTVLDMAGATMTLLIRLRLLRHYDRAPAGMLPIPGARVMVRSGHEAVARCAS